MNVLIKKVHPDASIPVRMSAGASGFDLFACLPDGPRVFTRGRRHTIPTGIALAIPEGYEGQIRPRSGWAARTGLTVLNAPGTVDSDYRGEIAVILIGSAEAAVTVDHGDRIAQLVIAPVPCVTLVEADRLPPTLRGDRGFGSTGRRNA